MKTLFVSRRKKPFFYPKMALQSMCKNGRFYLPYLLAGIFTVCMSYLMCAMKDSKALYEISESVTAMLAMGCFVIAVFAAIFLFYTNNFLMKRRTKELGLYQLLGMEKRHLSRLLFFETLLIALGAIVGGLVLGIVLNKLMLMLLFKLMGFTGGIVFEVSSTGIASSVILFGLIYLLIYLRNLIRLGRMKPIELLHSGATGEREPKTRWLLAIIGLVTMGAGYWIALTIKSPIAALSLFFLAVLLVIVGTYCLFTAGSIALLKILRSNKKYYYKSRHFINVSGMLYRMRQNAVGLANICILSTMVLVVVSTTVSLRLGVKDALNSHYPTDIDMTARFDPGDDLPEAQWKKIVCDAAKATGRKVTSFSTCRSLSFTALLDHGKFIYQPGTGMDYSKLQVFGFITADQYQALTGNAISLQDGELAAYSTQQSLPDSFDLMGKTFRVTKRLPNFPEFGDLAGYMANIHYIVVADDAALYDIYQWQFEQYGRPASGLQYKLQADLDGTDEQKLACFQKLRTLKNAFDASEASGDYGAVYECRQEKKQDFYGLYGGLLFLGLFLGFLFLMITVLIIYYKQISEGYEDRERFQIMEKVGMSRKEVRSTIHSQVLTVFFLPICVATIHLVAAFPMMSQMLQLLNLSNVVLFGWCTAGTVLAFALVYALVYLLTAKVYDRIVS